MVREGAAGHHPPLAPGGPLVHHQHGRVEHAHVLLPLGDQVGLKASAKFCGNFNKDP